MLEIPERHFDAFTVTFSPSHGYHALAALATAGERLGLNRKNALTAAAHALAGGISRGAKARNSWMILFKKPRHRAEPQQQPCRRWIGQDTSEASRRDYAPEWPAPERTRN